MKKLLPAATLLAVFCCLAGNAFAQKSFVKGYYVTAQNDTVECLIDDKNWHRNPAKVQYKLTETGSVKSFEAPDIKGFTTPSGDTYVSEIVSMDRSYYLKKDLKVPSMPEPAVDTVFLRVLVRGEANLLSFYDGDRNHYYYQSGIEKPVELLQLYTLTNASASGKPAVVEVDRYKGQLKYYFRACPDLDKKLNTINFEVNAMISAFRQYNTCMGNAGYVAQKEKSRLQFGVVGGPVLTDISFPFNNLKGQTNVNFNNLARFNAGVALNIVQPRNAQQWSIYNEVLWKPYSSEGHYREESHGRIEKIDTRFDVKSIGLNSMIRYQLPLPKLTTFFNVGLANNFNLEIKSFQQTRVAYPFSEEAVANEKQNFGEFQYYETALLAGAGLRFNKVTVELRGELGNGFGNYHLFRTTKTSVGLLACYYLNQ